MSNDSNGSYHATPTNFSIQANELNEFVYQNDELLRQFLSLP